MTAVVLGVACAAPGSAPVAAAPAAPPALPIKPISLDILDIAGDLAITKPIIENYVKAHPRLISGVQYESGGTVDATGKLQAQQTAGRVTIHVVLTGIEALAQMQAQNVILPLLPAYSSALPDLRSVMNPGPLTLQQAGRGYGVLNSGEGDGPLLEYSSSRVGAAPTTPRELLDWAKAHPGRLAYANPTGGSGPSNEFIDSLPYQLGDSDPSNPAKWDKTWAYLQELNKYTAAYPTKTADTFDGLAKSSWDITLASTGWDEQMHQKGSLGDDFHVAAFQNPQVVVQGHFLAVPRGVDPDHLAVALDLMSWMLRPDQQALTFPNYGSFPVKGVALSMATPEAQGAYLKYGRPAFRATLASEATPIMPLSGDAVQAMYDQWNTLIGSKK